jgi:uncharacterized peroxidase-related enzyme
MPLFPSIVPGDRVPHVFAKFNTGVEKPLLLLHHQLMRSKDSPFSFAQRELLAAYISGLFSDCGYCIGIHGLIAERFGIQEGLIIDILKDIDNANIDDNFKPILHYVKKLTLEPTKMTQADSKAVLDAGWSERALYDALMICCAWNFMNRFVEGVGIDVEAEDYTTSADMLMDRYDVAVEKFKLK